MNFAIVFEEYVNFGNYMYDWWFVDLYIWLLMCEIEDLLISSDSLLILSLYILRNLFNYEELVILWKY